LKLVNSWLQAVRLPGLPVDLGRQLYDTGGKEIQNGNGWKWLSRSAMELPARCAPHQRASIYASRQRRVGSGPRCIKQHSNKQALQQQALQQQL
jgi:hypothetical protein